VWYNNDKRGAAAYSQAVMLKIILLGYAHGLISSRRIARACETNIMFMSVSGDVQPHYTSIAGFVAKMHEQIEPLFTQVLMICDAEELIDRHMFAIDGCKLKSNASKEWSGKFDELERKKATLERASKRIIERHQSQDGLSDDVIAHDEKQKKKLDKSGRKITEFLATHKEKTGSKGREVKSNITDPDSAKSPVLLPTITTVFTADSGFNSEENLAFMSTTGFDSYIADSQFRKRNPLFKDGESYHTEKEKRRLERSKGKPRKFTAQDFHYDKDTQTCRCPAGNIMWCSGNNLSSNNKQYTRFTGYLKDCQACPLQVQCMRKPPSDRGRQVQFVNDDPSEQLSCSDKMKVKIDSPVGRRQHGKRLGCIEPVFGNITTNKGMNKLTLRGQTKVNAQWQMYCLVHNIEKLRSAMH
jgi:hypothetical protein